MGDVVEAGTVGGVVDWGTGAGMLNGPGEGIVPPYICGLMNVDMLACSKAVANA
jgi:hypothetical protein